MFLHISKNQNFNLWYLKIFNLILANYMHLSCPNDIFFNQAHRNVIIQPLRRPVNLFLFAQKGTCSIFASVDSCSSTILCKNIRTVRQYYTDVILPPFIGNGKHAGCLLFHIVNCHSSLLFTQLIHMFIVTQQDRFRQKINTATQQ